MTAIDALEIEVRALRTRLEGLEASLQKLRTSAHEGLAELEGILEGVSDSTPDEIHASLVRGLDEARL